MQMPDKHETVEALRLFVSFYHPKLNATNPCGLMKAAADLIESLSAELEQVKRERDAAVRDLVHLCAICVHDRGFYEFDDAVCTQCCDNSKWQWRGANGKGDEQNDI